MGGHSSLAATRDRQGRMLALVLEKLFTTHQAETADSWRATSEGS